MEITRTMMAVIIAIVTIFIVLGIILAFKGVDWQSNASNIIKNGINFF